jgi:molybdenum cofactor cytidylyltransferase
MLFSHALRVQPRDVISFVGGGGKSMAMFRLADELVAQGKHVVTTTTTRLYAAQAQRDAVLLQYDLTSDLVSLVGEALGAHSHVIIVGDQVEEDKVAGVPPTLIDNLIGLGGLDAVLVEADGARRRPLKAPAIHEPVVPHVTTVLVPVVGVMALGAPLDEEHVHRPELVARITGSRIGQVVTPLIVARLMSHAEGGLKGKPAAARAVVLINQVDDEIRLAAAHETARLLLGYREIDSVAIGAAQDSSPIREVYRRVAAIVLAAGAGTRMGNRVKQLLPWRGGTLIENAVQVAIGANVNSTVVVLGARAEEIRAVISRQPARVVINADWEEGHSTSIREGLRALSPEFSAAIFMNADQPQLTPPILNAIIQRYRETGALIVAARYRGKRGSPVLFDRAYFAELSGLRGEEGGREVLSRHPVEYVDFDEEEPGFDVDTPEDYAQIAP